MIKVKLHASRTHLSLPKMRRDNQMAAAATKKVAWPVLNATAILRFGVRGIRTVKEVRNGRCDKLFDLGGNEETGNTNNP